ncbi:hypothetical protein smaasur_10 [Escherichia phage smaasur]|uniref:Uncharacterized protein n=1 Tax=Escherichia phage smaasur TaxID=2696444 RepID=A0A6B9X8Z9_9CAUD|nr:hypothetical protein smaasur_10 [Escherichia phage smaasur]
MSRYQKVLDDTVVDGKVCGACHGSGTFHSMLMNKEIVLCECEACGGTGTSDPVLQRQVLRELGLRSQVQPGYSEPTFIDVPNNKDDYE